MKKVLVTGADGFIGSHLTEILLSRNYKVKALSFYNSFNNWGWLESLPCSSNLEIISGDIRDPHFCKLLVKNVDIIFHLAALIAIPYSYISPDSYIDTNIKGTLNICQAAKEVGNIRLIHTSTSEVYGTAKYVPIPEEHPKQPQSPYSASKIGADAIALSFFNAFSLPVSIARPFNTYGPRQSARAIIPSIIIQIAKGCKKIKLGDISPTRDFNYVKDTCQGLIAISEKNTTIGKEINIATNSEFSIEDILILIKKIMKSDSDIEFVSEQKRMRPKNSEVYRLVGDNKLLFELTGFNPKYSVEKGLIETCNWFNNSNKLRYYKADIYNV